MLHEFVEYIPDEVSEGVLYVSMQYGTAVHKCCCGCGQEVVTPITPTDWQLIFDGESISLNPSIGNWSFECQSHYFIKQNKIMWCGSWKKEQVLAEKLRDKTQKIKHFQEKRKDKFLTRLWSKIKIIFK